MKISTRKELKEVLAFERKIYKLRLFDCITRTAKFDAMRYVKLLRICEYHKNVGGVLHNVLFTFSRIRKNALGKKLGVEIGENACGKGMLIYHPVGIVINGASQIGENLRLHGNNCIGNSGQNNVCPRIGDNCELGFGAVVIGEVEIGSGIKIGANATVVKDCPTDNVTLVGTPARIK